MPRVSGIGFYFSIVFMGDKILESLFLDKKIWEDVIEWGVRKRIPHYSLEYIQGPHGRGDLLKKIAYHQYQIEPPHTGYAKKENGDERTFFINDPLTRLLFHAIYLWLMRNEGDMIHPSCLSYHEGVGIGKIVKNVSRHIQTLSLENTEGVVGRKFDIHHYFDTVPRTRIHETLDVVESHHGYSSVIDLIRQYYDSDIYYDTRKGEYVETYQGIKQGCAISSWFANTLLYSLDEELSSLGECYTRYSDDILYVGRKYEQATTCINNRLEEFGLAINSQKTEEVRHDRFVRFLGFDIRGAEITLSEKWVKKFQDNIDALTIHNKPLISHVRTLRKRQTGTQGLDHIFQSTIKQVVRFLYFGNGIHSWASLVLPVINREEDLDQLSNYCLDALRAVYTGKTNIGGLGKSKQGGITRGKGRNVKNNRESTEQWLPKFTSIKAMQKVIHNPWLYRTLVHNLLLNDSQKATLTEGNNSKHASIADLEEVYDQYLTSRPDGKELSQFYAKSLDDLTIEEMITAKERSSTRKALEEKLNSLGTFQEFSRQEKDWFWQSQNYPELVVLKEWFDRR